MENKYKNLQFHCRMKLATYKKLRQNFKALPKESAASYFERLSKYLDRVQAEWDGFEK